MRKLTLKKAKELSIKKWERIVSQNGSNDGIDIHPDFKNLKHNCGLCQRYIPDLNDTCVKCPLTKDGGSCCEEFFKWNGSPSKKTAQAVLNHIKTIEIK